MYRQSKLAARVAMEDAKKKDDRQADRFHGKSRTQKGTTAEILRNPNRLIKTLKKSTDEQTNRQQI
jgi:hypothetical protein